MSNTIEDFLGFVPNEVEAAESFEGRLQPIPNGKYKSVAIKAEKKNNKAGTGWYWELTFSVLEGEYAGREVIHRFNIVNDNDAAAGIGRSQMKRFLDCIGNNNPKNEDDMLDIPLLIEVKCKESTFIDKSGQTRETINNEITQLAPISEGKVVTETQPTENNNNNSDAKPWARKKK
jgi:hypothetical protein